MNNEYEKTALLTLPSIAEGSTEEKGLLSWSRPYLINEIRDNGVDVVVSRGIKALNEADAVVNDVIRPSYDTKGETAKIERLGSISLNNVDVIRNILRPIKADIETPQLNPNTIRTLARNKFAVMDTILEPANVYARKAVLINNETTPSELSDTIDTLPGDFIVAKPNGGQRSRGVMVGSKAEVLTRIQQNPISEPYIVEEKLQFANQLPGIRGRTAEEHAGLQRANELKVNREVRTYYFGDNEWDVVGRVAKVGETDFRSDDWLQLDLDSTLETLIQSASDVMARIRAVTGSDEVNIALDWVYASSASNPEPSWQVMELNAAEPQLVQLHEDQEVGRRQHTKMAKQISRIALS